MEICSDPNCCDRQDAQLVEYHVMRTRYSQYSPDHYMASHAGLMTHQLCSALNEFLMRWHPR